MPKHKEAPGTTDAERLSALTLLVYQAAQDPDRWGELVARLGALATPFDDGVPSPERRRRILDALVPHIDQAVRLEDQLRQSRDARHLAEATLERLPIGIAVVDGDLHIVTMNRIAAGALSGNHILSQHQGRLRVNNRHEQTALHDALSRCLTQGHHQALALREPATGTPISLLICPSQALDLDSPDRVTATVFLSHGNLDTLVDETVLQALYRLTPAESKVAKGLARGQALEHIADSAGVAPATVRAQLKAVFRKTDTGRQAELVSLILSGLAPLGPGSDPAPPAAAAPAATASATPGSCSPGMAGPCIFINTARPMAHR